MKSLLCALFGLGLCVAVHGQEPASARSSLIIVVGAGGEKEYAETFAKWAATWEKAGATADAAVQTIGLDVNAKESLTTVRKTLQGEPREGAGELWLVLLGHGNPETGDAKFNLTGEDLAASELATLLQPFQRPLVIVGGFSSSGAFLQPLHGPDRIIVTATKSGAERNFTRLGGYLAETIASPEADLDRDGQTSVLEAWLSAATRVAQFYKSEGRLATEHSLLEDNGDGKGTPPDWFKGVRAVKKSKDGASPDGQRAQQTHLVQTREERALSLEARRERDALELDLGKLRERKAELPEDDYFRALEALLLKIARLYEAAEAKAD